MNKNTKPKKLVHKDRGVDPVLKVGGGGGGDGGPIYIYTYMYA